MRSRFLLRINLHSFEGGVEYIGQVLTHEAVTVCDQFFITTIEVSSIKIECLDFTRYRLR